MARSSLGAKGRWALSVVVLVLVLFVPVVSVVRIHRREVALRLGVRAEGTVVGIDRGGDTDYLRVSVDGSCFCVLGVATTRTARHPVGSTLPIRYDPNHAGRAEALVDAPNPYAPVLPLVAGVALGVAVLAPLVWVASRRRRSLALARTGYPTMRVRVEAWRITTAHAPLTYLSLYPAGSPAGAPPLLSMAIDAKSLARLRSGQTFDLYGEAVAGRPVALRDGDVVIVPAAKTRPPSWEAENRARWSGVALGSPSAEPSLPAHGAGPLLATRREARAWQRRGTSVLWLWSILLVLAAVTRLLATELPLWVLPVLGLAIVGAYGTLWRQTRLLDRLARRLPGPPPATRRARRAARAAVAARLSSEAGLAETASLLATTPQRLRARQRIGTGLVVGSIGLVTLLFVGAVLFPSAVDSLRPVRRPRPPIAGAPGYTTFTGPLGRPLAVGRPWGRACQPVLFSVGEGMPPDAYADVAAVVAEAKRQGLNVAVASLASTWFTGSPYYPPGLSADDVQPVRLTYDTDPPRKLANGKPVSVSYQWGARADPDGRHEILTGATGQLWLADLSSPIRRRNAIREIVAFTQGVSWPARSGPGLRRPGADAFNPPDIAAMQLMSGCGDSLVPHWSPPSPPTSVLTVAPAAN